MGRAPSAKVKKAVLVLCASVLMGMATALPAHAQESAPYAHVIRQRDGELQVAEGPVQTGDLLLSIPFSYLRTGILAGDARVISVLNDSILVAQGTPGFYVGTFVTEGRNAGEVWCFFPDRMPNFDELRASQFMFGGPFETQCLFLLGRTGEAAVLRMPRRYLFTSLSTAFDTRVSMPAITLAPLDIEPDLRLEYRFRRFRSGELHLTELAGGQRVRNFELAPGPNGVTRLSTIAGVFCITAAPDNRREATIAQCPYE